MEFLDRIILDNSVRDILTVAAVIAVVLIFKQILSRYIASGLYFIIQTIWKGVERKQFVELVFKPMSWLLSITVALIALHRLTYPAAWDFKLLKLPFDVILEKTGVAIWIFSFIKFLLSVVNFISLVLSKKASLTADKTDDQLVSFFRDFIKVIIWIIGILLLLKAVFNQNVGYLLTSLSIVGAALALSAKESLENLIASFIIFFDKPFFVGDTVKVNSVTGSVERIGLRSTRIRTADKTLVTVPNKQMVDSIVDNWSMRSARRAEVKLELSDKTPPEKVAAFIDSIKKMLEEKKQSGINNYTSFLFEFNKNGPTVFIEYFTAPNTMAEFNVVKQSVNFSLMQLVKENQIDMASNSSNLTIISNDSENEAPKSNPII
ncbi:MAG: mechanosensitive ion channel [Sphingobacteriales bacterium]|nr:MAG: mechanosensitive ion channel [Sphingobacteriales bacterium]